VAAIAEEIQLPAFAIGGINLDNVASVVQSGLSRVAVNAAITAAEDPQDVARSFKRALARPGS
jgi:thiamine-phosphate pyrophosphorylase